jgi:hypothetical protein
LMLHPHLVALCSFVVGEMQLQKEVAKGLVEPPILGL